MLESRLDSAAQPDVSSLQPSGLRRMTSNEVVECYATLRLQVLKQELGWTKPHISNRDEIVDSYDSKSIHLGMFRGTFLHGGARLVLANQISDLPCGSVVSVAKSSGAIAEISRVAVAPQSRRAGLLSILLNGLTLEAIKLAIETIYITIPDEEHKLAFLKGRGFDVVQSCYGYSDEIIHVPGNVLTLASCHHIDRKSELEHELRESVSAALRQLDARV